MTKPHWGVWGSAELLIPLMAPMSSVPWGTKFCPRALKHHFLTSPSFRMLLCAQLAALGLGKEDSGLPQAQVLQERLLFFRATLP